VTANNQRVLRYLPWLGLGLLLLLLPRVDFREAWQLMQAVPPNCALSAITAYSFNVLLKAVRWHRMLRHQGTPITWHVSLAAFLSGAFYGMLTIGRLGELLRAETLTQHNQSRTAALANSLADRLLDAAFLLLVALGCLGLLQFDVAWVGGRGLAGAGLAGAGLAGAALAVCMIRARRTLARGPSDAISPPPLHTLEPNPEESSAAPARPRATARLLGLFTRFVQTLVGVLVGPGRMETLAWTACSWAAYFWAIRALARGLALHAPNLALVYGTALGTASAAVPISFQGLGTREAVLAATLAPYGVSTTQAVTLSLTSLALFYVVVLPVGGAGVLWHQRQRAASLRAIQESTPVAPASQHTGQTGR
jgi:uncharacterized membrane protein YbhN (UPF0104 family)